MSDEPVDPRPAIEEACKPGCASYWKKYEECAARVQAKGEGHCSGQYFEFYHCIDHCAAPKIFKHIK